MPKALAEMTDEELEAVVQRAVDERLQVWLTQLMDALSGTTDEDRAHFKPDFAESLRRSIDQASAGELTDLESFRQSIGDLQSEPTYSK